jgi:hypothetical protein
MERFGGGFELERFFEGSRQRGVNEETISAAMAELGNAAGCGGSASREPAAPVAGPLVRALAAPGRGNGRVPGVFLGSVFGSVLLSRTVVVAALCHQLLMPAFSPGMSCKH